MKNLEHRIGGRTRRGDKRPRRDVEANKVVAIASALDSGLLLGLWIDDCNLLPLATNMFIYASLFNHPSKFFFGGLLKIGV